MNRELDLKLIRLVKATPILYDKTKFSNYNEREVAWQKIGDKLRRSSMECKERWTHIRDFYKRKSSLIENGGAKRKNIIRKTKLHYKYHNELLFLIGHYKNDNDNAAGPQTNCDAKEEVSDVEMDFDDPEFITDETIEDGNDSEIESKTNCETKEEVSDNETNDAGAESYPGDADLEHDTNFLNKKLTQTTHEGKLTLIKTVDLMKNKETLNDVRRSNKDCEKPAHNKKHRRKKTNPPKASLDDTTSGLPNQPPDPVDSDFVFLKNIKDAMNFIPKNKLAMFKREINSVVADYLYHRR